jgi:predicted N-formylglutamate amidohydrolase
MTTPDSASLLDQDEPGPVVAFNSAGSSPFLILGDHAGNAIPRRLSSLGLSKEDRERHIAWDIGVRGLGELLATALNAPFLHQHYSRLVIDCNRDPASTEAIPEISDGSLIPGNTNLTEQGRGERIKEIHEPYHDRITLELDRRSKSNRTTILIALHSFTPIMAQVERPWHVGMLYSGGNTQFATALMERLSAESDIIVGDNEPYQMDDTDHTIPHHAFANRLPYVELEIRQNLIAEEAGQRLWNARLSAALETTRLSFSRADDAVFHR